MTEKGTTASTAETDTMQWARMMSEFWNPMVNFWSGMMKPADDSEKESAEKGRMHESLQAATKMWQAMTSAMSEPAGIENFQKATRLTPDILLGFSQTCMQGFLHFQSRVHDWVLKHGADTADMDAQSFDSEFLDLWTSLYENELSKYLKIPQIGLGRVYQERILRATDELNRFQAKMAEFMHLLYLPMEKSFQSMQEKMAELATAGPLDDKSKTYYDMWIRELEGHYMEMFKTEGFSEALGQTLTALNSFVLARREVVNDVLKSYSIPTNGDLDELYKEIHLLKKRLRVFEQQLADNDR